MGDDRPTKEKPERTRAEILGMKCWREEILWLFLHNGILVVSFYEGRERLIRDLVRY